MANIGKPQQRKTDAGDATAVAEPAPETEHTSEAGTPEAPAPPEAAQPKRGRGRPPNPPKVEESIGFFDRLKNLTLDEWEDHMAYLYRTEPFTDAKKGGASSNYVTKYGQAFDEEVVKHECGSGGYKIILKRVGSDGKAASIDVYFFEILDPKCPPKIAPGIWLDDPRNEKWAWAKAAYEKEGETPQPAATAGAGDMPGALHAVAEIIKVLKPGDGASADPLTQINAISKLLDRQKPETAPPPPDPVAQFTAMAIAMKSLMPAAPQGDANVELMKLVMTQNTTLLNRALGGRSGAPQSPSDIAQFLTAVKQLKGLSGSTTENPWIGAVLNLADKLAPALETYVEHVAMRPRAGERPAAGPTPVSTAPGGDLDREAFMHYRSIIVQVAGPMITHLKNGQPGGDFAAWFVNGYDFELYEEFKSLGREKIMQVIQSIPEIRTQMQPIEHAVLKFIDEFLAWEPEVPEEKEEPQTVEMPTTETEEPTQ